jgi:hypothetical protein
VLSLLAFIGMPPAGCGAGHPITYQRDIILIAGLSIVVVLVRDQVASVTPLTWQMTAQTDQLPAAVTKET